MFLNVWYLTHSPVVMLSPDISFEMTRKQRNKGAFVSQTKMATKMSVSQKKWRWRNMEAIVCAMFLRAKEIFYDCKHH